MTVIVGIHEWDFARDIAGRIAVVERA